MWEALSDGIANAQTDFVMNLNMDDRLAVDGLEALEEAMLSGADMAGGDWDIEYTQEAVDLPCVVHPPHRPATSAWPPLYGEVCRLGTNDEGKTLGPATIWRRYLHTMLGSYPTEFGDGARIRLLGDVAWWDLVQRSGFSVHRIPNIIGNYRSSPSTQLEFRFDNKAEWGLFHAYGARPHGAPSPLLSILVCHLAERDMQALTVQLHKQLRLYPEVEVIIATDNGEYTVGKKRNELMKRSRGEYVAYVDDDDMIPDEYAESILSELRNPELTKPTHCELHGVMAGSGSTPSYRFHHSIAYKKWSDGPVDGVYQRTPNHLNAVRRDIAVRCPFPEIDVGEDRAYSEQLLPMLGEEAVCVADLYSYYPSTGPKQNRNEEPEPHGVSLREIMKHPFTQDLMQRARKFAPSLLIAQPRRSIRDMPIQKLWEFGPEGQLIQPFGVQLRYAVLEGKPVDVARNQLIGYALTEGFKHMLFVDDDTALPYDALQQLLHTSRQGHPVVSGIVTQKFMRRPITMIASQDGDIIRVPNTSPADELVDVNWITGMACLLIDMDAIRDLLVSDPVLPPCVMGRREDGEILFGEDFWFSQRVLQAGIPIVADRAVQCLHVEMKTGNYWCHPDFQPDLNRYRTTIELKERNTFL